MFTGDRSGDFLFAALWRAGFANQPTSQGRDDGLTLKRRVDHGGRALRAAGEPPDAGRARAHACRGACASCSCCASVRVVLCLGAFAWDAALRLTAALAGAGASPPRRPRPRFGHGAELAGEPYALLGCYHPSQQNTFTGKLTEPMIDAVLRRARELAGAPR